MNDKQRVVVTGLGIIAPQGNEVETAWQAIQDGVSGVRMIDSFEATDYPVKIAATVQNFASERYLDPREVKRLDPFIQYGIAAADQAMLDADLQVATLDSHRIGVAIGSGIGGIGTITKNHAALLAGGPKKVSPFFIPSSIANMVAGQVSIRHHLQGPNICIVTACTTGSHNIGMAARMIAGGDADVMLAGGSEMATTPVCIAGFHALRALSTRNDQPAQASRPWDRNRDGFVLGEGAGVLVLESYEHAKKRGARVYAELVGFGMSADAYHITTPNLDGEGAYRSMAAALHNAHVAATQVDYINAHSTSTPVGDEIELKAIERLFGRTKVAVSSTKSMTGHLLGAAGAIEAIFTVLSIRDNVAPPTINLDEPPEDFSINLVPHEAQKHTITYALSNSFGFGGTNASLLFKKI